MVEDPKAAKVRRWRATDPERAAEIVTDVYLPHRLDLNGPPTSLAMDLAAFQLGAVTVGQLSYHQDLTFIADDCQDFYVVVVLRGTTASRHGGPDQVVTHVGQGLVFSPGAPAEVCWTADGVHLCLKIDQKAMEGQLERLLGRPVTVPLRFAFGTRLPEPLGRRWQTILRLVGEEVQRPSGLVTHPHLSNDVESMVLDALLLSHPNNYSEALHRPPPHCGSQRLQPAIDMIEADPARPWSVGELAAAVHLSVRSLQEAFRRELDDSPLSYLRKARLRAARQALTDASLEDSTVKAIAAACGFHHPGRFAAEYHAAFGESPATTLRRER